MKNTLLFVIALHGSAKKGASQRQTEKNASEDICFATISSQYTFNVNAVKLKRRELAPYVNHESLPKDWKNEKDGTLRLIYPSNLWTDLTVPFWPVPENTTHPTQKPEKLLAKIILASSDPGDFVSGTFAGSDTTSVAAKNPDVFISELKQTRSITVLRKKIRKG